jgi:cell division protease FtsH
MATRDDQRKDANAPPAPRGSSPTPPERPWFRPSRGWILFAVALLAVNFYLGSRATRPEARVRVPYTPFFLQQVREGHVKEITSKGTALQGTFKQKVQFGKAKPSTRFRTEIPAFADNDALSRLLQEKRVVVNAQPLDTGAP